MKNITLISDWKLRDPYVGMFKGELFTAFPDAHVIDITHSINTFHLAQTAFILKNSYRSFPQGSLHIILTGLSLSKSARPLIVQYDHHWFLGEDNGIFALLFEDECKNLKAWQYPEMNDKSINTKIIEMAGWCFEQSLEKKAALFANDKFIQKSSFKPSYSQAYNTLTGEVIFIDAAANAITNIPASFFHEVRKNRNFTLKIVGRKELITSVYYDSYRENKDSIYLVPNRLGYIEISFYPANIAAMAAIYVNDRVEITFE